MATAVSGSQNHYNAVVGVDAACCVISVACICLRLYVRKHLVHKVALDDWLLLFGVILFVASCILDAASWLLLEVEGVNNGWNMSYLISSIDTTPYLFSEAFVRSAYAVFYLRVIPKELNLRWQRYVIISATTLYVVFQTTSGIIYLFECGNPANLANPNATCISLTALNDLFYVSFYLDAILDWMTALIPIAIVLRSTMTTRMKVSVVSIMLLGCMAGCLALSVIIISRQGWDFTQESNQNPAIVIDILTTVETLVAIICLTLAALRPLFRKWLGHDRPPSTKTSPVPMGARTASTYGSHSDSENGHVVYSV